MSDVMGQDWAVRVQSLSKVYGRGADAVTALRDVSVAIPARSFTAVMGTSGSGKSTFLQCAAGLDRPTSGSVFVGAASVDLSTLSEGQLAGLRRERIGFVFQAFNLLPALTVRHNITLPLRLAGRRTDRAQLAEVLAQVGLSERGRHFPAQLSGGEQQRVAIARALITRPQVIFADEPTGALDLLNARAVLALLRHSVHRLGQTVVMVTHDPVAASSADSVLFLAAGRLAGTASGLSAGAIAERVTKLAEAA